MANVRYFEKHNYEYIIMAKTNATFIKEIKNEYGPYVKKGLDSFIKGHDIYGLTYKKKLFNTDKTQYVQCRFFCNYNFKGNDCNNYFREI